MATVTRRQFHLIVDIKHWQNRAEEARARAETFSDPDAKQAMLSIAEGYEKLGELAKNSN